MKFRLRNFNNLLRIKTPSKNMMKTSVAMQKQMQSALKASPFFDDKILDTFAEKGAAWMVAAQQHAAPQKKSTARQVYPGQFIAGLFRNEAGARDYKLYIPSTYTGQIVPLLVMLHGCTQDPDDFVAGTRMNNVAEHYSCLVLYPAQNQKFNGRACWNWLKPQHQSRGAGEPAILAGMTEHIANMYTIDKARIYVAGLSAGGAMSVIMGATYPELFAAIGIHSGLAYQSAHDLASAAKAMQQGSKKRGKNFQVNRCVPAIVFHGDRDTTVNVKNADSIVSDLKHNLLQSGVKTKRIVQTEPGFTRAVYNDKNGQTWLEDWRVHGGDHTWFGGSTAGSHATSSGPNASDAMMRFFLSCNSVNIV